MSDVEVVELTGYALGELERLGVDGPVLPVRFDGALVLVGPVLDGSGVCLRCAEDARLAALGAVVPRADPAMRVGGLVVPALRPVLDALVERVLADPGAHRDRVLALRSDLGAVGEHRVRPRPEGCARCGPLPEDSAEAASVVRAPVPVEPGSLRGENAATAGDSVRRELFDLRHGPVGGLHRIGDLVVAAVSAELVGGQAGFGRTGDYEHAERVALFEAVERHAGLRPRRVTTVVEASFAELGPDRALDPVRLGLPDLESPHVTPYRPDVRIRWVHGWSYTRGRAVAVPEHVAYWGRAIGPRFVDETSNGCGTGNSLTEAVLHGLFEVAERDAFLTAWYGRVPLPSLRSDDGLTAHVADRLEQVGYRLELYDATNDLGVPSVLSLARRVEGRGGFPCAFYAAGAGLDVEAAVRAAAAEVVMDVEAGAKRYRSEPGDYELGRLRRMLREPRLVRTMDDHVNVNALPEALGRHDFLVPGPGRELVAPDVPSGDLDALLEHYVRRWEALGLEVIAVDQSDPVVRERLGLCSAKVIVPGAVPMTFGEVNRRTGGIPRLRLSGPPLPHPFP
ncbi:TOMM precursor leader peptide-binding protein [Actinosynnema pretiosum subsp. pretiosum]|uniref:TOMM leader peptide-binding protein n=1 Tax=Actinosynnema pretiosum subsp. pretiosum TaxID=103721 RepID=A0AA45R4L5_9PSEU|nr:TOMM biosynthesis cyclodehydratase (protein C) / TOMM biosynthesis docking scaffold (protein D) [Actinosynnema pretiosum subsp. pretiosum]QUF04755.1 TOMM precursor leader peptide-binding protein [Actinosynnema pretiosum subsp. pretiosum]